MPLAIFSFESYSIADNENETFYFMHEKLEQRVETH